MSSLRIQERFLTDSVVFRLCSQERRPSLVLWFVIAQTVSRGYVDDLFRELRSQEGSSGAGPLRASGSWSGAAAAEAAGHALVRRRQY